MNLMLLSDFYERLQDEESRTLFSLKYEMLFNKGYQDFIETLLELDYPWEISAYDEFRSLVGEKKVVIFGAGIDGRMTYDILQKNGVSVYAFCDNNREKQGTVFCGCEVIAPVELHKNCSDYYIIIASHNRAGEMLHDLTADFFPRENIWYPRLGTLYATTGCQYFDCPELYPLGRDEVFIDAGCLDMGTSRVFADWCKGEYGRIIAFEPDKECYKNIQKQCEIHDLHDFEVFPYATWDKNEEINFFNSVGGGGRVSEGGGASIVGESIDNILGGGKVTFIKLDVEGAELKSLKGTANTIRKYKPRLAISLYHKPSDIYEIPQLLMEYRPDYRFYIRHYTSYVWETVLYAV